MGSKFKKAVKTIADPGNIFKKREGGMSASGLFDPGGTIVEAVTGSDKAKGIADPGDLFTSPSSMMGRMVNPEAAMAADMAKSATNPTPTQAPPSVDTEKRAQLAADAKRRERLRTSSGSTQLSGRQMTSASVGTTQLLGR